MTDTPPPPSRPTPPSPPGPPRAPTEPFGGHLRILLGLGTAVLFVAIITLIVVVTNKDEDERATTTDPTTSAPDTSETTATTDTSSTSTTSEPEDEIRPVIVADGYVLGYWDGDAWVDATTEEGGQLPPAPIESGVPYLFVDAAGHELRTSLGPVAQGCHLGNNWGVFDDTTAGRVGIPLGFDALPRTVAEIEPAGEHNDAVAAWLVSEGEQHPFVSIDRVLRVDLDGDGRDEVFIEASNDADGGFHDEPGAYSVLLYRYLDADDQPQTVVVAGDLVTQDEVGSELGIAVTHRLLGILDLNQDGTLEIVTRSGYYEGVSVDMATVDGPRITTVLSTGCGA